VKGAVVSLGTEVLRKRVMIDKSLVESAGKNSQLTHTASIVRFQFTIDGARK
jgi:hypothetical protein